MPDARILRRKTKSLFQPVNIFSRQFDNSHRVWPNGHMAGFRPRCRINTGFSLKYNFSACKREIAILQLNCVDFQFHSYDVGIFFGHPLGQCENGFSQLAGVKLQFHSGQAEITKTYLTNCEYTNRQSCEYTNIQNCEAANIRMCEYTQVRRYSFFYPNLRTPLAKQLSQQTYPSQKAPTGGSTKPKDPQTFWFCSKKLFESIPKNPS